MASMTGVSGLGKKDKNTKYETTTFIQRERATMLLGMGPQEDWRKAGKVKEARKAWRIWRKGLVMRPRHGQAGQADCKRRAATKGI